MVHNVLRAYAFECTYDGASWVDDPSGIVADVKAALGNISNFDYARLIVSNVRNSSRKNIELEIVGITYKSKTKLTAGENDDLIYDLNTNLLTVTKLSFLKINIVNDVFNDDPTSGWPGQSFKEVVA